MASISSIPKTHFHVRSVSLPSRSSQKINGLTNLFNSIGTILKEIQHNEVNELLDELLRLLELCSTAKDALLITSDSAQVLQSVLRRKRGDGIELSSAIQEYQSKRKAVKKAIVKTMRHLKVSSVKKIQETPFSKVESITSEVLESLLFFIHGKNLIKNSNKWSMISKLLSTKQTSEEESVVGKVDVELAKKLTCSNAESLQKELAQMELSLEDLQGGLECIYRHLIKTRVFLLNLHNC